MKCIKPVEFVVALACVAIPLLLTPLGMSWTAEAQLLGWERPTHGRPAPEEAYSASDVLPVGVWSRRGMASVSIKAVAHTPSPLAVSFSAAGCCASWRLERLGTVDGSSLLLDRPVREYGGTTYDRFHLVRVKGFPGLLPDGRTQAFNAEVREDEPDLFAISYHLLMRREDRERLWDQLDAMESAEAPEEVIN